ncbi:MAG: hypothetical protein OHK0011_14470 [Turneriella sp.]
MFYLPPVIWMSSILSGVRVSLYRQFFKRFGLLSCGIVFLNGLQFFSPPDAETSRVQLQSSETLHIAPISDAVLEEAPEGGYRFALGVIGGADFTSFHLLISSSVIPRQLLPGQSFVHSLHSSRAPPVI